MSKKQVPPPPKRKAKSKDPDYPKKTVPPPEDWRIRNFLRQRRKPH